MKNTLLLILGLIFSSLLQAQTPQTYVTFGGDTLHLYKYEGEKTMLLAQSNNLDTAIMRKWTKILDGTFNFYKLCTGREPDLIPSTYINNKTTIANVDLLNGAGGRGNLGGTGIELLDTYFNQCYTSILFENKYEQITFYEFGRNFWFYGNKLSYENDPITTGYAVFMRFMSMKYLGVDDYPSHIDFVNQIRELRNTYIANSSLNWSNTLGVAQGVPGSPWGATDLFASFCLYLEEKYGWQWIQNVWQYAGLRPDRVTTQDAVDNFIIASSQAANSNLISLFQEWRWPVSQSAIDYINTLDLGKPKFYVDYNGVTIKCMNCVPGDTGRVNGVLFEAVDRNLLIQRLGEGADLSKVCTSLITDMNGLFYNLPEFNQPIGSWDLSNVTNLSFMFNGASKFNQPIGSWNVSNVTDMSGLFTGAEAFNKDIASWNVSSVQKMDSMFMGAFAFNQNITNWNVISVRTMEAMFCSAYSFNQNIGEWNLENVLNMSGMFWYASVFNQPIGNWDVSNVTDMNGMFYMATSFNQNLKNWCVINITSEPNEFSNNSALTEVNKPDWGNCPQTFVPDDNFEQALVDLGYDTAPLDNNVRTVKIKKITNLDISNKNIADLTGIKDFSNLTTLKCYSNHLTSLDFTQNNALTYLDCQENQLTSLDLSNNMALTLLNCTLNQLTNLDVSKSTFLINLFCSTNLLSNLDLNQNPNLYGLHCSSNNLTGLDLSVNTKLRELQCQFNQLKSLDVSNNTYLNYMNCIGNKLTFESLEPAKGFAYLLYSPQDSVGITQFPTITEGENYSYSLEVGGENNIYKWYKNDVLLSSQTSATLNLTNVKLDDAGVYRCLVTNSVVNGLTLYSRKITLTVNKATYADEIGILDNLNVYPNPVNDILFFDTPLSGNLKIYDINGKIVLNQNLENLKNEIDVSELVAGTYLLRFVSDGSTKSLPLIKK